uniref:Putative capsid protein n=1 Tax=viral metagenome TaxID=1070528 RepID=A0A6M3KC66_9ZZZZ
MKDTLLKQRESLLSEVDAILAKETPTEEELNRAKAAQAEVRAIDDKLSVIAEAETQRAAQKTSLGTVAARANEKAGEEKSVGVIKDRYADDAKRGFKTPREFLLRVMDAGRGRRVDDRLKSLRAAGSDEAGEYADPYGGFLVPAGFITEPLKLTPEADPIGGRVMRIPMTNASVNIPARVDKTHTSSVSGGLVVYRRAETDSVSATRTAYEQITLRADSLMGVSYATNELLNDSPVSFAAIVAQGFQDEFASRLIDERINGTGVGQFLGAMKSPCLETVAKESAQSNDTIVYANIVKMRSRCWNYGKAIWLANHDTMPQIVTLNAAFGTAGALVWQPSAVEDHPDTLFGRPLFFTEYCQTLGDLGDILLGDWSQYLEGTLQNAEGAESIHVRFVENETCFRFTMRNAGAPWWRAKLTPKYSATTLSPFVTLAAR